MTDPSSQPAKADQKELLRWIATCPDETKDVLAAELAALGVRGAQPIYRGVAFEADLETAYRAHLALRTASRIQRIVASLPAGSAAELQAAVAQVRWPDFLLPRYPFSVSPILTDDASRALGEDAVRSAVAEGIAQGVAAAGKPAPRFDPDHENPVLLMAHVRAGICTLGLDTAGRALHKRGWRLGGHPAVLKETLAASLLLLAGYDGTEPLLDPMCGSGTIAIEGAYIALRKAPLIHRGKDDFGFERQAGFDRTLWRRVSDRARAAKLPAVPSSIFASDVRADFVELARRSALRARVEKFITFTSGSLLSLRPPAARGLLVTNLPYGERIHRGEIPALYRDVGRTLRERFSAWRLALLVPDEIPTSALGLSPEREVALKNGALDVRLLLCAARR